MAYEGNINGTEREILRPNIGSPVSRKVSGRLSVAL
jgi:hypothetical protein